ncbi:hypothetical protein [Paenibacillus bovis]|uniref:Uncharacterized protein n=1 Tax=Paenibacillus bovis TaxID=1616788 RepID=A0A172ZAC1_9BACL|nr:hypothetical protein [Paenibacillus bovis]ANF94575.1 hypothetical protein AR543_00030 [Paenibacillus bovis]
MPIRCTSSRSIMPAAGCNAQGTAAGGTKTQHIDKRAAAAGCSHHPAAMASRSRVPLVTAASRGGSFVDMLRLGSSCAVPVRCSLQPA